VITIGATVKGYKSQKLPAGGKEYLSRPGGNGDFMSIPWYVTFHNLNK
jgi:hypothetical protein